MHLLLISGSTRAASTNTAVLRTAQQLATVETTLYGELSALPAFNPDDDREPLHPAVTRLREQVEAADAILFCTPEYAGALPGSFKNLLDWTVGGTGMDRKPVAWINVSSVAAPTGGADAHDSLRKVLGYLNASIVEEACARLPMTRQSVDADGLVSAPAVVTGIRHTLAVLAGSVG
ncbi:NAD(P)H-dependent FMN reductase [Kribbella voronezhensis]|uniref:NAD(P)H-dependent FMN reductase n=1 Tax=Kribbella voronezhensis TaxID=2512212 RepID=A0A4V3FJM1_9ACTN|nr:NADPH-dependent FMN reductase [Kribbella voronezhensis]TDU86873.1 NAD(P)H-dependent FMN reductase [Kribbella voronezhensis]